MKITMLGTGNALVTEVFNTCYLLIEEERPAEERYFLVDAGGGAQIFAQFKRAGIDWTKIHELFLTHRHIDHFTGMIWMVRRIAQGMKSGKYTGDANIYGHTEVIGQLETVCRILLDPGQLRYLGERIHLTAVSDGESREINGKRFTFFDIGSTKAKQFGYRMYLPDGRKLCCCGEEPYNAERERQYAEHSDWLLHEAFCLYAERERFRPYEKHHSTVRDAAELAEGLGVKNLLLYHTEDRNILRRKELYTEEAEKFFRGRVYVPEDLETIVL